MWKVGTALGGRKWEERKSLAKADRDDWTRGRLICGSSSSTLSVVISTSLSNQDFFPCLQSGKWSIFEPSALEMCLSLLLAWQSPGQVAGQ